jgi:pilus assembly protein CpaE
VRSVTTSHSAATVVLVGIDTEAMGMVRETLAAEAVLPNTSISFDDAVDVIKRTRPDVVIVDYSSQRDGALELAQVICRDMPNIAMVALAHQSNAQAILAAMRVGYKEFVVLPDDAARLRQVVHESAYAPSDDKTGLVMSFIGAKGGVGTTLLATHLATELAAIHRVLLIDLDFGMGDIASVMDLSPKDTIADLLPRADRVDERSLTGSVVVHRTKVHVLATPSEMDAVGEVRTDDVYNIIMAAAKGYQFVVIDCGVYLDQGVAIALNVSEMIVLVTTPDVTSVRDSYRRLRLLENIGVEKERVRLVVNRYDKGAYITLDDIKTNLGIPVVATIDDDPKLVQQAINEGKLLREINRKGAAARTISALVGILTEDSEGTLNAKVKPPTPGFFSSLFGRG